MTGTDIAHLTFLPPHVPGSYNRLVAAQLAGLPDFTQVAISFATGRERSDPAIDGRVILVGEHGLSAGRRLALRVPERVRSIWFDGMGGRDTLAYAWQLPKILARLRPRIIVSYDGYKLAPILRRIVDWPCRLVLSQHGLSYYLPADRASRLYSTKAFDVIWVLTRSGYRRDRSEVSAYEPLVSVIPNGVDTDHFQPASPDRRRALREKWRIPPDRPVVLMLSRLVPKKGAHLILHSWARVLEHAPDAFLWIVGGGDREYEAHLKRLAGWHSGDASVCLQGSVAPGEAVECYQASDVYLFPTLFCEGMPLSVLEALSCGLPCIASDHAAVREMFGDEELVIVNDPNVEDAFVEPIVRLLGSKACREQLGRRGRAAVLAQYRQDEWLDRLRTFYRRQLTSLGD